MRWTWARDGDKHWREDGEWYIVQGRCWHYRGMRGPVNLSVFQLEDTEEAGAITLYLDSHCNRFQLKLGDY